MSAGITPVAATEDPVALLRACYDAALAAVEPGLVMRRALRDLRPHDRESWLICIGKAAAGCADALTDWLASHEQAPAGGVVITPADAAAEHQHLRTMYGDHPVPGAGSAAASGALRDVTRAVGAHAQVHVAISGGTSALIASPLPGLTQADVVAAFQLLLASGLDIHQVNAVRKRLTQWSAGRLAIALPDREVHLWLMSDVPGDEISTIGSGPCSGDPWSSAAVIDLLRTRGLWPQLSRAMQQAMFSETPKPGDSPFDRVESCIVANNRLSLEGAAAYAHELGHAAVIVDAPLAGDAATMARTIISKAAKAAPGTLMIWGGETTVSTGSQHGLGGRSQQLALAAAQAIHDAGTPIALLAAGTDGRDGPTDAAGAIVDASTWHRVTRSGRDPAEDLAHFGAYRALAVVDALLPARSTGTNVADIVLTITMSPTARS